MSDTTDETGAARERAEGRFEDARHEFAKAMASLEQAVAAVGVRGQKQVADALRDAHESLEEGNLLDAVDQTLALDEQGVEEATLIAAAVASYCPEGVTVAGGAGASLEDAITFEGTESGEDTVAACYHYLDANLDALLGDSESVWRVERCAVVHFGALVFDVIHVEIIPGDARVFYFNVGGLDGDPAIEQRELGSLTWAGEDGEPDLEVDEASPEAVVGMVMGHLMLHASMDMVRT